MSSSHDGTDSCVDIAVDPVEPGQVVQLAGRLDVHGAADVRLALADAVELGTGDLVIDLALLEAVDATGLGVLVGAHRRAGRAGRTLVLRDVTPPVHRVLFLTRLDRVLRLSSTDAA
jgi:anti-anti-sigma factor